MISPVQAQVVSPFNTPIGQAPPTMRGGISPYLNLALPGNPGLNYYGLVVPQVQQNAAIQQLQNQNLYNQQAISGLQSDLTSGPITGAPFGFQNHWGYFQNWRRAGTSGSFAGAQVGQGLPNQAPTFGVIGDFGGTNFARPQLGVAAGVGGGGGAGARPQTPGRR